MNLDLVQRLDHHQGVDEKTISLGVGMRPAEVCGLAMKPISSRSAMTLRIVAGESSSPDCLDSAREPTGWPSAI